MECLRPDSEWTEGVQVYSAVGECLQVAVIRNQGNGIWWVSLVESIWQYPLLQGRLLTPYYGDGDGVGLGLWVRDGQGGSGETRQGERDLAHNPSPPKTFPPAYIPPSQSDIPEG